MKMFRFSARAGAGKVIVEKLILIVIVYFVLVQFVFPKLGLKPG
jgi:hypothetical protein